MYDLKRIDLSLFYTLDYNMLSYKMLFFLTSLISLWNGVDSGPCEGAPPKRELFVLYLAILDNYCLCTNSC